ncbi:MAG: hypothetical protein ABIQ17_05275, partial [Candidatus Limnocylindrales bacterium]
MKKRQTKRSMSEQATETEPIAAQSEVAEFAVAEPVPAAPEPEPPAGDPGLASGEADATPPAVRRGPRPAVRFLIAFVFALLAVLAVAAGALAAYESSNATRILPGVHSGDVDLSGLSPSAAAARLREAYAALGDGTLVLVAGDTERTVTFA